MVYPVDPIPNPPTSARERWRYWWRLCRILRRGGEMQHNTELGDSLFWGDSRYMRPMNCLLDRDCIEPPLFLRLMLHKRR